MGDDTEEYIQNKGTKKEKKALGSDKAIFKTNMPAL